MSLRSLSDKAVEQEKDKQYCADYAVAKFSLTSFLFSLESKSLRFDSSRGLRIFLKPTLVTRRGYLSFVTYRA